MTEKSVIYGDWLTAGIGWGRTFTPLVPSGFPSYRFADWSNRPDFTDGTGTTDPDSVALMNTIDPITTNYLEWTYVWDLHLHGINLITLAGIPAGSKITQIEITAKIAGGELSLRGMISREQSFNPLWLNQGESDGINTIDKTFSASGSYRKVLDQYVNTDWQIDNQTAWDFLLGDDYVGDTVYMYFWVINSNTLTANIPRFRGFRINKIAWVEPSVGSGILLGNL